MTLPDFAFLKHTGEDARATTAPKNFSSKADNKFVKTRAIRVSFQKLIRVSL
jgi:hypothetical protein